MEGSFYRERLEHQDISVVVPEDSVGVYVHDSIVNELTLGQFTDQTRAAFLDVSTDLTNQPRGRRRDLGLYGDPTTARRHERRVVPEILDHRDPLRGDPQRRTRPLRLD